MLTLGDAAMAAKLVHRGWSAIQDAREVANGPARLYFLFQPGCPACEAAREPLEAFMSAGAPRNLRAFAVDLTAVDWPVGKWAPDSTPTYLLVREGVRTRVHSGIMDVKELKRFCR